MLDDSVLDDPDALTALDRGGLLRGAAESGALSRSAAGLAAEAGLGELRPDGRPRALLVAGPGPSVGCAADLLGAFTNGSVPVTPLRPSGTGASAVELRWTLPGWAGPVDLLLVLTHDGAEPGLVALAEQAYRRGCTVLAVAPPASAVSATISPPRGLAVPLATAPGTARLQHEVPDAEQSTMVPGGLWALLTPLLMLTDRLGLGHTPPDAVQALATRLDEVAGRCGPAIPTHENAAKSLAQELADALPLIWSETPVADAVGRHFATMLGAAAGRPAASAPLPEALVTHRALLSGEFAGGGEDDIFRDRVEEPEALRALAVLLHERTPAAGSAAPAARELAYAHSAGVTEIEAEPGSSPLEAAAELIATVDFAAVYLGLTPNP
ncbi:mannose-6-phosphate isomerase [Streptomyces sp. P38-E01]|uniref:Mannose-6-phosphate isomerase n=1 Tax=Streptomyces tardus TaxID=2780544 RepID=A0A949JFS8_9ACTN|nr:SIS domain-containing protein [Streptomyces tardus]MBU7598647.1 mannose-6-phosphate isomerase [Streptomyces tardus]